MQNIARGDGGVGGRGGEGGCVHRSGTQDDVKRGQSDSEEEPGTEERRRRADGGTEIIEEAKKGRREEGDKQGSSPLGLITSPTHTHTHTCCGAAGYPERHPGV